MTGRARCTAAFLAPLLASFAAPRLSLLTQPPLGATSAASDPLMGTKLLWR